MTTPPPAEGGQLYRRGLTNVIYHVFDKPGKYTFKVNTTIPAIEYLVVGAHGGSGGNAYGGGGEVKKGATAQSLPPGTYTVEVGSMGTTNQVNKGTMQCYGSPPNRTASKNEVVNGDGGASSFFQIVARGGKAGTVSYGSSQSYGGGVGSCYWLTTWIVGGVSGNGNDAVGTNPRVTSMPCASGGAGGPATSTYPNSSPGKGVFSSITGENVEYGHGAGGNVNAKNPSDGIVIIAYDSTTATPAPTKPPGPSQEDIDRIVKEYDAKMAELKAAMEAENKALAEGNAAASQQAQLVTQKLTQDLVALKQAYDNLQKSSTETSNTLQTVQQQLAATKNEYESKMQQLMAARQEEVDALNAKNSADAAVARAEQIKLTGELTALKATYDSLVKKVAQCPVIPEGTVLVDGGTGQLYKFESGALRVMSMDTYRALGSPGYTTWPAGSLDNCAKGPPLVVQITTSAPTPQPDASVPRFNGTLYAIIHASSWKRESQLKVLSSRFGGLAIEPFEFKSLDQTFLINDAGFVRSLTGRGPYVTSQDDCLAPILEIDPPAKAWRITRAGSSPLGYRIMSSCGSRLMSNGRDVVLDTAMGDGAEEWYIVAVGKAQL